MNTKKTILATLTLFIVSNVLTTIWYMLTDEANFLPFRRSETNYVGLLLNHLIFAIGFVYLFPSYIKGNGNYSTGSALRYGVLLAAIMFLPTGFVVRSIWQVDFNLIFLWNTMAHLAIGGLMGILLLLIYNYKRNATN
ncbi:MULTISPECIES: hypothetical protein [Flavobacteriaceae]|uniref:hypothetical protein n=1 Tax=Flavobacteriaceae TaxID=49546 RepID=UPI001490FD23|nr:MULTISPECIES: hypothetical protein [Allomuricauda]MDC6366981.1 hypothetical protein [Muricauda sp. AC10]